MRAAVSPAHPYVRPFLRFRKGEGPMKRTGCMAFCLVPSAGTASLPTRSCGRIPIYPCMRRFLRFGVPSRPFTISTSG